MDTLLAEVNSKTFENVIYLKVKDDCYVSIKAKNNSEEEHLNIVINNQLYQIEEKEFMYILYDMSLMDDSIVISSKGEGTVSLESICD